MKKFEKYITKDIIKICVLAISLLFKGSIFFSEMLEGFAKDYWCKGFASVLSQDFTCIVRCITSSILPNCLTIRGLKKFVLVKCLIRVANSAAYCSISLVAIFSRCCLVCCKIVHKHDH